MFRECVGVGDQGDLGGALGEELIALQYKLENVPPSPVLLGALLLHEVRA